MQYPLELRFKLLTFGQRITATDKAGNTIFFIKQKMFKLKEQVQVFADTEQKRLLFQIAADRVLDFSASYHFTDAEGNDWGSVRRRGMRSLWSAHYEILEDGKVVMAITEESPIKKIIESLLGEIPILGLLAVYLLNPSYRVVGVDNQPLLRLVKRPAIFEGVYQVEKLGELPPDEELRSLLAMIMLVLLERKRG
ncbi:LURP-one-related/scramblase family protein [Candidatus Laterigemmans baculatus]|uniref:hypothetical protein n=1 Tax=Candidatus Laterigemmans baculatus TaxID=2770505 RepID=UPI0013DC0D36|nr:hypothetical protein [Candidatus Laterigemmans baculatus]